MKKIFSLLLAAVLLLGCFASAEANVLTKLGFQQRLNKAFAEKAESVTIPVSPLLVNQLSKGEGVYYNVTLMAWKAGIIYYTLGTNKYMEYIALNNIVYADEPLPYVEAHSREEYRAALDAYLAAKTPSFGILYPDIESWDNTEEQNYLFRRGVDKGTFGWHYYFVIGKDMTYVDHPIAETVGIDGFNEAVAAFREAGIKRFAVALDDETMKTHFGADVPSGTVTLDFLNAGILLTNDVSYLYDAALITFDVAFWTGEADDEQIAAFVSEHIAQYGSEEELEADQNKLREPDWQAVLDWLTEHGYDRRGSENSAQ